MRPICASGSGKLYSVTEKILMAAFPFFPSLAAEHRANGWQRGEEGGGGGGGGLQGGGEAEKGVELTGAHR